MSALREALTLDDGPLVLNALQQLLAIKQSALAECKKYPQTSMFGPQDFGIDRVQGLVDRMEPVVNVTPLGRLLSESSAELLLESLGHLHEAQKDALGAAQADAIAHRHAPEAMLIARDFGIDKIEGLMARVNAALDADAGVEPDAGDDMPTGMRP